MHDAKKTVDVIGAGPAGLVAALNLAKAGIGVTLHEAVPGVGHRFHGDFQGIENWTTQNDVRDFLKRINVDVNFRFQPYRGGIFVSPSLEAREIQTREPLFYLVERGSGKGCLDVGLLQQAEAAGVKVKFNTRTWNVDQRGVTAVGPRAADLIAKGAVFETNLDDQAYAIVDDRLTPKAYAYLLVNQGRATLATVIARDGAYAEHSRYHVVASHFYYDQLPHLRRVWSDRAGEFPHGPVPGNYLAGLQVAIDRQFSHRLGRKFSLWRLCRVGLCADL